MEHTARPALRWWATSVVLVGLALAASAYLLDRSLGSLAAAPSFIVVGICALAVVVAKHSPVFAQGQGQDKQLICHVSDDNKAHIIEVAAPAVPAHLAEHGGCLINSTDRELIGDECDATDANNNDICDVQP